jgi:RNA polymerase sigma-70 factor (ECF subfamily)
MIMVDSLAAFVVAGPTQAEAASVAPFEELYRLHAAGVHRFCVSQVGDRAIAEDLTHETYIRAFAAFARVRPDPATARPWLLSIARNLARDHHRRSRRTRLLTLRLQHSGRADGDVEGEAEQRRELRRVSAALATMRPRERELIGLRVAADLPYRQIAEMLGSSESIVKVATHRALTKLRSRLEEAR